MFKVLVLDDDMSILEVVSLVLTRRKIEVVTITDPGQLQTSLQEQHPDLLLMDIALGYYDGRDLCRQLKDDSVTTVPVVLFSAQNSTDESIVECKADAVIRKPFQLHQLYAVLDRFLV